MPVTAETTVLTVPAITHKHELKLFVGQAVLAEQQRRIDAITSRNPDAEITVCTSCPFVHEVHRPRSAIGGTDKMIRRRDLKTWN